MATHLSYDKNSSKRIGLSSKFHSGFLKKCSYRLEKYLNLEGLLEKIKSALKSTGKSLKGLEKSLNSTIFFYRTNIGDRNLNRYKIVVPLFGAPNKGTTILN